MLINQLNNMSNEQAFEWFYRTCASTNWCNQMVRLRPFSDIRSVKECAKQCWRVLTEDDFLEAFAGHPMIGDLSSLKEKFKSTQTLASSEQASTDSATDETLLALQQCNQEYLDKNGFIFIICATGLSADFMLNELKERLRNTRYEELMNAAEQQIQITLLRIHKALIKENNCHE